MYDDDEMPPEYKGNAKDETISLTIPEIRIRGLREEIVMSAVRCLVDNLRDEMRKRIDDAVRHEISEAIEKAVAERVAAIVAAPVQPTDRFGNPKGEPVSIAEMAEKITKEYLEGSDSSGYNQPKIKRMDAAIAKAAGATVEKIASQAVGEAISTFKADLATAATKEMGTAVLKLLGMKP